MKLTQLDRRIIAWLRKAYLPLARISLFTVFFWFGVLKVLELSPATSLAKDLMQKTVGISYFDELFIILALLECAIGVLFLMPKLIRLVFPLLLVHMSIVCAPLFILPTSTWQTFLVPTLEGQYIIKNILIIAVAFVIAAHTIPLNKKAAK